MTIFLHIEKTGGGSIADFFHRRGYLHLPSHASYCFLLLHAQVLRIDGSRVRQWRSKSRCREYLTAYAASPRKPASMHHSLSTSSG